MSLADIILCEKTNEKNYYYIISQIHRGDIKVIDLSEELEKNRSCVREMLERLYKFGLVERVMLGRGYRWQYRLTEKGLDVVSEFGMVRE